MSKKILRIILLLGTISSMFFVPWPLVKAYLRPLPDTVQAQLEESLNYGFDGIVVHIDQAGKEAKSYAAGWHNREKKIPAQPKALFKIASIGKLYDAVAITKLVSDKRLSLNKTLADYFPELKERIQYADEISLSMLVQHRSGIPNYTNQAGFWSNPPQSQEETLALILDQAANFKPGTSYEYSNTNYLLLTALIEKTLSYGKFQYIQEEILRPLGLKNTFASLHDVAAEELMSGYYIGVDEDIKTADYGSMIATAEDVAIFLRALNDGTLLNPEEQKTYASIYKFNHTGLIPGYQSIAKYHADIDAVVVQFTNTTDFEGYQWNLSEIAYKRIVKICTKR